MSRGTAHIPCWRDIDHIVQDDYYYCRRTYRPYHAWTFDEGLQQAVDKEGAKIQNENQTPAVITSKIISQYESLLV
jgi:preprotein translocase subunit SecA